MQFKFGKTLQLIFLSGMVYFGMLLVQGCGSTVADAVVEVKPVDTTITPVNAFINVFLDSARMKAFIGASGMKRKDSAQLLSFYRDRNYQYAWFDSAGIAEQAVNFVNLYRSYRETVGDSSLWVPQLDTAIDKWLDQNNHYLSSKEEILSTELLLTWQFFKYAQRAYGGGGIDLADLGWFIPRKKMDVKQFLDSVIISGGRDIKQLLPVHPLFENLRKSLDTYNKLSTSKKWEPIHFKKPKYVPGDSAEEIGLMKVRLIAFGDLAAADTSNVFTTATATGVKNFQARMGLAVDGVPGKSFFTALNVPLEFRMQQILVNMERARWIPKPGNGAYIVVNIPEFRLHVFDSGRHQFDMAVVVGKPATNTVIFNGTMKYVVFAPYWNVPYSIVKNEMGRTASYFSKRNMEITGRYADGLPQVRQKPGPSNALGRVKFLFPNSYSIYLHDTPSKGLFGQDKRAFSHGCIRVAQPEKLAHWALRFNPEWPSEKIEEGLNYTKETTVNIAKPIPVFIGYFTCWVDQFGKLNFRNDLYGHDKKLAEHLFPANN